MLVVCGYITAAIVYSDLNNDSEMFGGFYKSQKNLQL